jgi:predicted AlkP superfamily phosphohydrolase/phosphomutase
MRIPLSASLLCLASSGALLSGGSLQAQTPPPSKMVVLGVDGMDPKLLGGLLEDGELPNVARVIESGGFRELGTSNPPQSPVAWSSFITGLDPGGHGLFDFLALDRSVMQPYLSSSAVLPPRLGPLKLGNLQIPLGSERTVLLRNGTAFWEMLEEAGVDVTIFNIPANYPPVPSRGDSLSGMGTPDLRGSPGTFMFFSTDADLEPRTVSGGELRHFEVNGAALLARIIGPPDALRADGAPLMATLEVLPDPDHEVALLRSASRELLVNAGEWTEWLELDFGSLPGAAVPGMVRLYLKSVHPRTELYVSPVNIDPRRPAQIISSPEDYAPRLAEATGPFYTQEMPEDTNALSAQVLSPAEFLAQSSLVLEERRRILAFELDRFNARQGDAFLFFYLSSIDQRHHMMARHFDSRHPAHSSAENAAVRGAMRSSYREVDALVGAVLEAIGDDVALVIMSDHGFSDFHREAHLNTWLERNGYLTLLEEGEADEGDWLVNIDWSRTTAFAMGLNSLYVNVAGRERDGIVPPTERLALAREIAEKLEQWVDEETGMPVVTHAALREEAYRGPELAEAPDLIVGYGNGYRASWATTEGRTADVLIEDNLDEWSGDHCVDPALVPGVFVSNLRPAADAPRLVDLTVGILDYFGVAPSPAMRGSIPFEVERSTTGVR